MALQNCDPTKTQAWAKLQTHFNQIKNNHMMEWFAQDAERANKMTIEWEDFYVDYSKNRITQETLDLFLELAEEIQLGEAVEKYFSGDKINQTEDRAVLHTALRSAHKEILVDGVNVLPEIDSVKKHVEAFSNEVISGERKGYTGKSFTDIVNIGIGGSDLGPAMVVESLKFYKNHLNTHFVSNVDGDHLAEVIKNLDTETTLFVVVSKTFTTQETISNASTIRNWFLESASEEDIAKHFVAVSTNLEAVKSFGIAEENIFPMWDWVGGRFSLWSAVGLSISLSTGYENYLSLLDGARKMDEHFRSTSFDKNIPTLLAFLSVWYNNFFDAESEAIIPYSQYLNQFATYLQQAVMESNGKSIMRDGKNVTFETGNIVWGEPGTNSQHAFFQLIHQGTKLIPTDFIGFVRSVHGNKEHHDKLTSNFLAQTEALLKGKSKDEVLEEFQSANLDEETINALTPFKIFEGNKPTNTIFIKKLTPESLGKLIALYEHKIFVQGVIWNIFSYDQFGVELGKQLAGNILKEFGSKNNPRHDASTQNLIDFYGQNC